MKHDEEAASRERRMKLLIHWTGQAAAPFYDASKEVEEALTAVHAGNYRQAVNLMKGVRAKLKTLQEASLKPYHG